LGDTGGDRGDSIRFFFGGSGISRSMDSLGYFDICNGVGRILFGTSFGTLLGTSFGISFGTLLGISFGTSFETSFGTSFETLFGISVETINNFIQNHLHILYYKLFNFMFFNIRVQKLELFVDGVD
jgi:hypothetical protein